MSQTIDKMLSMNNTVSHQLQQLSQTFFQPVTCDNTNPIVASIKTTDPPSFYPITDPSPIALPSTQTSLSAKITSDPISSSSNSHPNQTMATTITQPSSLILAPIILDKSVSSTQPPRFRSPETEPMLAKKSQNPTFFIFQAIVMGSLGKSMIVASALLYLEGTEDNNSAPATNPPFDPDPPDQQPNHNSS